MVFTKVVDDLTSTATRVISSANLRFEIEATPERYTFRVIDGNRVVDVGHGSARLLSAEACEWFALIANGADKGGATFIEVSWR